MNECFRASLANMTAAMEIVVACSLLLGLVIVAAVVWMVWIRPRFYRAMQEKSDEPSAFTIEGLMELRDRGQITQEEFRTLRRGLLGLDAESSEDKAEKGISASSPPPARADGQEGPEGEDSAEKESE
jgi:hypothetical protein